MKKTDKNLNLLYVIFGVALVTANAISGKLFDTGVMLFGFPVTMTTGALCYPITFLITDIIGEVWGKKQANQAVKYGFVAQIISTLLIVAARYLPAVSPEAQDTYVALMGQNYMFVIASLSGYLCSQKWDVYIFHKIRDAYIAKHGTTQGGRWLWNNGSTMTSQLIDTVIFVVIAFGIGFGWLFDSSKYILLLNMIIGQYLFKVILAALDTPFFYLFTNKKGTQQNED